MIKPVVGFVYICIDSSGHSNAVKGEQYLCTGFENIGSSLEKKLYFIGVSIVTGHKIGCWAFRMELCDSVLSKLEKVVYGIE